MVGIQSRHFGLAVNILWSVINKSRFPYSKDFEEENYSSTQYEQIHNEFRRVVFLGRWCYSSQNVGLPYGGPRYPTRSYHHGIPNGGDDHALWIL